MWVVHERNCTIVVELSVGRKLITVEGLTGKRRKYSLSEKGSIVDTAVQFGVKEAVRRARNTRGFETVSKRMISRWHKNQMKPKRKMGRPGTDSAFNDAVLNNLLYIPASRK